MTKTVLRLFVAVAAAGLAGCGGDDDPPPMIDAAPNPDAPPGGMAIDVTADITADTTWEAINTYTLKTHIFVRGGTLTIEPGTQIFGDQGSSLVITQDGRIDAQGTAAAPIVFTSSVAAGGRVPGDWGGVVLLGRATINVLGGTNDIEGFPAGTTGTTYGGTDDAHDCGTIRYVRIEFAGFELAPGNELNGLTVGACGSATELDFIQVHKGSDDGIEFFGGTVNINHLVVSQVWDDGIDWDFGWVGRGQFLIVQQSTASNQGIEADNNGDDNEALPRSMPTIYNLSIIGSNADPGTADQTQKVHLRRGTAGQINNAIVAYMADFPVDVDGASTVAQTPANLFMKNTIFFDNGNQATWVDGTDNDGGFDEGAYFKGEATNLESDPLLSGALDQQAPSFQPGAGSPALVAGNAATPPAGFDVSATFIGAVGATDWTTGWTSFPQN